jgi:hypothetical protein
MQAGDWFSLEALLNPLGVVLGLVIGVLLLNPARRHMVTAILATLAVAGLFWLQGARQVLEKRQAKQEAERVNQEVQAHERRSDDQIDRIDRLLTRLGGTGKTLAERAFLLSRDLTRLVALTDRHPAYSFSQRSSWEATNRRVEQFSARFKSKCRQFGPRIEGIRAQFEREGIRPRPEAVSFFMSPCTNPFGPDAIAGELVVMVSALRPARAQ